MVQLPYKVNNTLTVLQLGSLKKKQYHTTKVLYPLGFKSVRNYYCCKDPRVRVDYKNEVLDGGTHPIFKVTHPSGLVFSGTSPYMVWNKILDKVNAGIDRLKMVSVYGRIHGGFNCNTATRSLESSRPKPLLEWFSMACLTVSLLDSLKVGC